MKQRPARVSTNRATSIDDLVARGAEQLAAGRFKEAVETYRQLVKAEARPDWCRALAEAYVGRAAALAGKAMYKEAALVFDNADAADNGVHEPLMHLACLIRAGDAANAMRRCCAYLSQGVGTAAERERIADLAAALWCAGEVPPLPDAVPGGARAHAAAAKALGAWLDGGSVAELAPLISAISLRSAFKPLRFILAAAVEADAERRTRLLELVPADSAFAPLAQAVRRATAEEPLATVSTWGSLTSAARTFAVEVAGLPANAGKLLTDLTDAERRGPGALLDVLLKSKDRFAPADLRSACLNLLPRLPARLSQIERQFGPLPAAERHRLLALAAELEQDWDEFVHQWQAAADALEQSSEADADLARSIIYRRLADVAVSVRSLRRKGDHDADVAIWLEKSVTADPTDRDSLRLLIAELRRSGNTKEWARWADLGAVRFPNDAALLLDALEATAERGALRKAADLAKRVLALDPINVVARQRLIDFAIGHARKKMAEARPDLANKALAEAVQRSPNDGALTLVRGLVGLRDGTPDEAKALVAQGVERLGGGVAGWLRAVLEGQAMRLTAQETKPLQQGLAAAQTPPPRREDIVAAVTVLNRQDLRQTVARGGTVLKPVYRWLEKGRSCPFSAAEFQTLAAAFERMARYDLLGPYARAAAAREPGEPLYEFHVIVAGVAGKAIHLTAADLERLARLVERAQERQDEALAFQIIRFVDMARREFEYFDDFDEDDEVDDPFTEPGKPSAAEQAFMEEVATIALSLLEQFEPAQVVDQLMTRMGNHPFAKGIPKAMIRAAFTMMVETIADHPIVRGGTGKKRRGRR